MNALNLVMLLIVVASSIWVLVDARSIGIRKSRKSGFFNLSPLGWSMATLFLWIIAFPAYLILRSKLKTKGDTNLSAMHSTQQSTARAFNSESPSQPTQTAPKSPSYWIGVAVLVVVAGAGLYYLWQWQSTQQMEQTVQTSMNKTLNNEQPFAAMGLEVQKVTLVHDSGNRYFGMAKVLYKGQVHNVQIHVLYDGEHVMWNTDPGAFQFAIYDQLGSAVQKLFQSASQPAPAN